MGTNTMWGQPPRLSTDANNNTVLVGADGSILPMLGANTVTVGAGGQFPTLAAAVAAIAPSGAGYDLVTVRHTRTSVITTVVGSPVVTIDFLAWETAVGHAIRPGDLWKPAAAAKYYRVRSIDSDTQITLWENYTDTAITAASTTHSTYHINRRTIVMLPGDHQVAALDGASSLNLAMGLDIVGLDRMGTRISEPSSPPATPFGEIYDCNFSNLTFAPTLDWGDLDGFATSADAPAGALVRYTNVGFYCMDFGYHQGGSLRLACSGLSTTIFDGCTIASAKTPGINISTSRGTPTNDNTRVIFTGGTEILTVQDMGTPYTPNSIIYPAALLLSALATYDFFGSVSEVPFDMNIDPLVGNVGALSISAACVVNLHGHRARSVNGHASGNAYCIETSAAATVNIHSSDIEASGTDGTAIVIGGGATVNVRAGSRIKGSTNSIDCASGTVNVSGNADLIGATTGAGTINLATAT